MCLTLQRNTFPPIWLKSDELASIRVKKGFKIHPMGASQVNTVSYVSFQIEEVNPDSPFSSPRIRLNKPLSPNRFKKYLPSRQSQQVINQTRTQTRNDVWREKNCRLKICNANLKPFDQNVFRPDTKWNWWPPKNQPEQKTYHDRLLT